MRQFPKFSHIKKEALKDSEVKAAQDALETEYRLAESMIRARLAQKLTQQELAARASVPQTTITRLESGTNTSTIGAISKVARIG